MLGNLYAIATVPVNHSSVQQVNKLYIYYNILDGRLERQFLFKVNSQLNFMNHKWLNLPRYHACLDNSSQRVNISWVLRLSRQYWSILVFRWEPRLWLTTSNCEVTWSLSIMKRVQIRGRINHSRCYQSKPGNKSSNEQYTTRYGLSSVCCSFCRWRHLVVTRLVISDVELVLENQECFIR